MTSHTCALIGASHKLLHAQFTTVNNSDLNSVNPSAPNVVIILSASSCDFRQCPWEIGSATAERVGQLEVGECTRRVQTAWPCLGSAVERSWSALGGPFLPFLA